MIRLAFILLALLATVTASHAAGVDEVVTNHKADRTWDSVAGGWFKTGRSIAVVIGISDYIGETAGGYPALPTSRGDAEKMKHFLLDDAGFDVVYMLTDDKATKARIETLMTDEIPAQLGEHDRFLFYWSGHGDEMKTAGGPFGFLPLVVSKRRQFSGMISMDDIHRWDGYLSARHVLFVLDACLSGLAGVESKSARDTRLEQLSQSAHQLITAGTDTENVISGDKWSGSLFTDSFIRGARLESQSTYGVVNLWQLTDYIQTRVGLEKDAAHWTKSLTPQIRDLRAGNGVFFFARPNVVAQRAPPVGVLHVLAIGIDNFGDKAVGLHSNYAAADARAVAAALLESQKGGPGKPSLYADVNLQFLTNEKADLGAILDALDDTADSMAKNAGEDLAVIFASSQGVIIDDQFYLIPFGFDVRSRGRSMATALSASHLAMKIAKLATRGKVLVLLDACHSGAIGAQPWAKDPDSKALRDALNLENVNVLTSSRRGEMSEELSELKHGAFTRAFLDALANAAGGEGVVTMSGLQDAMENEISKLTHNRQHLGMSRNFSGDLFVAASRE